MTETALTPLAAEELVAIVTAPFAPKEAADLRHRRVTGAVDLSGRELSGFDLSGSRFEAPVTLDNAQTRGLSWFRDCRFEAGLSAEGALFGVDLRLDGARLAGDLTLSKAELWGALVLDRAELGGTAFLDAMQVLGSLSCAGTRFDGPVTLEGTDAFGGFWADGAEFGSRVTATGMEIHGRTWLRNARFAAGQAGASVSRLISQLRMYGYLWS
ncbi:hypothetical protein E0K89_012880 [Aquicoccus sp. SCR17]|nr:hypothetical protein [Carideicomes alvinocaridis]